MIVGFWVALCVLVVATAGHPTVYKWKDNKVLEPDLVPVSSTVIPIPVYKVGYGLKVWPNNSKGQKAATPSDGSAPLITAQNKKKYYSGEKPKGEGTSTVVKVEEERA